tara:strand:+ start:138 stop:1265 length:1128 start_codon:yes stop_codon:yes gene_type:complete
MAKKPGVTTIATGYYSRAALNANFEALNTAFDNTVSRDGSTPNTMSADLDMNSKDVINAVTIDAEKLILDGTLMTPSGVDPVFSGTVSAFGASLIDDANASVARTTLGLGTASTTAATDYVAVSGDSMTGNLSFGDNNEAIFGAGSDLRIFHDGANSVIDEVGTGSLFIRGTNINIKHRDSDPTESMITAIANGAATLFHNGSNKFSTTATGCTVTGSIVADNVGSGSLAAVSPSGTSAVNFTSIPAGVRQVTVMLDELSMSGSDHLLIQLGDSGGIETSGYISRSVWTNAEESTSGMIVRSGTNVRKWTGAMTFTRIHTTNRFVQTHTVVDPGDNEQRIGAGSKTLSAELTQLKLVPTGSNTFDNGSVSIAWSY